MQQDPRLRFLQEVGLKILDSSLSLEDLIGYVVGQLALILRAHLGYFYLASGNTLFLLYSSRAVREPNPILLDNELFCESLETRSYILQQVNGDEATFFLAQDQAATSRILIPLFVEHTMFGLMCFESTQPSESCSFRDVGILSLLLMVKDQLIIGLRNRNEYEQLARLSRMQSDFITRDLDVSGSLTTLLDHIVAALPCLKPIRISPPPEVQICFYSEGDEYLTVKATSGPESGNRRLPVRNSVWGMLVENPELRFVTGDPSEQRDTDKPRIRKNDGLLKEGRNSQLIVPIRWQGRLIGVIDLEANIGGPFRIQHIQAMMQVAEQISPMIHTLQMTAQRRRFLEQAGLYAINRLLFRFSQTYNHKLGSPITDVFLNLNLIKEKIGYAEQIDEPFRSSLDQNIERSLEGLGEISDYHTRFSKDLPGFLSFSKHSINSLISGAIEDLRPGALKRNYDIEIYFEPEQDYQVYCSLFLREHIYNIVNNARYALIQRRRNEPSFRGAIRIETSLLVDPQSRDLNQRCRIKIQDNGGGIEKAKLSKVANPFFTTKPTGTGFGLFAAVQYLKSIGGWLEVDAELNRFFEVNMYLDLYDDVLHENLDPFSSIYAEGI